MFNVLARDTGLKGTGIYWAWSSSNGGLLDIFFTVFLQFFYSFYTFFLQFFYSFSTVFLQFFLQFFYSFSTVFLQIFYSFSTVFLQSFKVYTLAPSTLAWIISVSLHTTQSSVNRIFKIQFSQQKNKQLSYKQTWRA